MRNTLILLFLSLCTLAQSPFMYHFDTRDGLPGNECYSILQSRDGYVWIATDRGVSRFDGYQFHSYTSADGLTDNTIFSLYEDVFNRIWFLSYNGKLCWYKNGQLEPYPFNSLLEKVNPGNKIITSFHVNKKNVVTIGYLRQGLLKIYPDGHYEQDPLPELDGKNRYFCGLSEGEMALCGYSLQGDVYPLYSNLSQKSFSIGITYGGGMTVVKGLKRTNGQLLFSLEKNLVAIDSFGLSLVQKSKRDIVSLFEDREGALWIGLREGGVITLKKENLYQFENAGHYLDQLTVTSVFQDSEGSYWFSSLEKGVFYMPAKSTFTYPLPSAEPKGPITAMCLSDKSFLYLGTSRGDVYKMNILEKSPHLARIDSGLGSVETLYYDSLTQKTWLGTSTTLGFYKGNKKLERIFGRRHYRGMTSGSKGGVLTVVSSGIIEVTEASDAVVGSTGASKHIDVLFRDHAGSVWVGGTGGLSYLKNRSLVRDSSVRCERVVDILETNDHRLVLASIGNGIILRQADNSEQINEKNGLISNIVNALAVSGNKIWAATNKGISQVRFEGKSIRVRNFSQNQGLQAPDIKKVIYARGQLWLGSTYGLMSFVPWENDDAEVPIVLESVSVNNQSVTDSVFSYRQNLISFNFKGMSFIQMGHIPYRYRLVGASDDWVETEATRIQFPALEPGSYRFELQAMNAAGIWNKKTLGYTFRIKRPLWQRPVFWIPVIFLIITLLFLGTYLRIKQIKKRNRLILELQEYQRQALSAQINPHFIFNSLNSIHSFILREEKKESLKYLSSFAKLMRTCLDHSNKNYVPLRDEYELLRSYIQLELLRYKNKFDCHLTVTPDLLHSHIQVPSMLLQPYIENAILHAVLPLEIRRGLIEILIFFESGFLRCCITDNGVGRNEAAKHRRAGHSPKGLEINEKRLRVYANTPGYTFYLHITDVIDNAGKVCGTQILFNIPYLKHEAEMPDHR